ncbi:endonuclease III [Helcococcus kunzii]|uniref:endonuclease III n=1 Tax=Helcococcus kunzii TaxID=40091 RepID=UPI001C98E17A|nr:endonuclease III [Helcococcus kunzii]MCT1795954.1 endonuclease III [Helcococcus kunzii]MCT1988270.1 endonuclease III [Helcococcus kunzii]QZO75894.1 endonuclease III [Helcococcus kunzii]
MKSKMKLTKKEKLEALDILFDYFPDAGPELNFTNEYELLVAVMLSAQTTDVRVNIVTKDLFKKYPTPESIMDADIKDIENEIKSIGLYRNKAKNLKKMAQILVEKFDSKVPSNRKDLESLPGVGRKTANVVLSTAFGIPAIAVDTHVHRTANRIGLVDTTNVLDTEKELMKLIPKEKWTKAHHVLIFYGRRISTARNPNIEDDPIKHISLHCRGYIDK